MSTRIKNFRFALSSLLAAGVIAFALAGCGGGSSSSSTTSTAASSPPPASTSTSSSPATTSSSASSGGIPQGANAGDQDADNHGGPSDGDGNI